MKPVVGRTVQYTGETTCEVYAAIITHVVFRPPPEQAPNPKLDAESNYCVTLRVLNQQDEETLMRWNAQWTDAEMGTESARGRWGWIPIQEHYHPSSRDTTFK
jgi:hypothetical protein